jgi:hypothetical protein
MTTLFNRNAMKLMALAAVMAAAPMAHALGSDTYNAYEELSGTHASASVTQQNIETPAIGLGKVVRYASYDAFEELSGTHANKRGDVMGTAGKSGPAGEEGSAGLKRDSSVRSDLYKIRGDVAGGCSQYLRCSGE